MSPIPSPVPLRKAIARFVFSPAGLMMGFVILLIATCPNARGESGVELFVRAMGDDPAAASGSAALDFHVPIAAQRPAAIGRSTRFDRVAASPARSPTPDERATGAFRHSRAALPILVDPLLDGDSTAPATNLTPMTGPTVGIRPRLPAAAR